MNLAQRGMRPRRPLRKPSPPAPAAAGLAATSLTIGQVRFPRGSRVPDEIVSTIEPGRLAVLMSNRLLMHRLGPPPTNAPVPLPPPVDPAVALAEQWAALERPRARWICRMGNHGRRANPGRPVRQRHASEHHDESVAVASISIRRCYR
jgi:hypothetical protein